MSKIPGPPSGQLSIALGALSADQPMEKIDIKRRNAYKDDVVIQVDYCGLCHSDIHAARNEWKITSYPLVPGHEVTGRVMSCGSAVTKFKSGDKVAVGTFVDSCRSCRQCKSGNEVYCETPGGLILTYNTPYKKDDSECTLGGYSDCIVVDQQYVFHLPDNLPMDKAAPLLCAGITVYSPLKRVGVTNGTRVAVAGLGGLGHMAVKFAVAMGARVAVISRSDKKKELALKMGASEFIVTADANQMIANERKFDVIVDTISAKHDYDAYLNLLDVGGTMVIVGVPPEKIRINGMLLAIKRLNVTGSATGSIEETKQMLELCSQKNITCDIELITPDQLNEAFDRTVKGDVCFRFVIDLTYLRESTAF
ncbi:hypothetical protein ACOME3_001306 [Neoechinorhynchus agilis]